MMAFSFTCLKVQVNPRCSIGLQDDVNVRTNQICGLHVQVV